MGQLLGAMLYGVLEAQTEIRAVTEETLEAALILGCRDDQDVLDARQHQRGQRVVDHRLVVDRNELLTDAARDRIELGAAATGEDDAFQYGLQSGGASPKCQATLLDSRPVCGFCAVVCKRDRQ